MTYNELNEAIENSTKADWLFNDERGIYTFKNDLNLRIQQKEIDSNLDRFIGEDWATCHPDPEAYRVIYEIYYGASFIKEKLLVSVDGHRATLPLPRINTTIVSREDYNFAEIIDHSDTLSEYMKTARLNVADE